MKLNVLKPLKRIFAALSGEETEDKNLVSVMDKIADAVEESSGGSSNENFIVIAIEDNNQAVTINKTYNDIKKAADENKNVRVKFYSYRSSPEDEEQSYNIIPLSHAQGQGDIEFTRIESVTAQEGIMWEHLDVTPDGFVIHKYEYYPAPDLPT